MGYNWRKIVMSCRSVYYFENYSDYVSACSALNYHLSGDGIGYDDEHNSIYIREDCDDIVKAGSICREHGGQYSNPD